MEYHERRRLGPGLVGVPVRTAGAPECVASDDVVDGMVRAGRRQSSQTGPNRYRETHCQRSSAPDRLVHFRGNHCHGGRDRKTTAWPIHVRQPSAVSKLEPDRWGAGVRTAVEPGLVRVVRLVSGDNSGAVSLELGAEEQI